MTLPKRATGTTTAAQKLGQGKYSCHHGTEEKRLLQAPLLATSIQLQENLQQLDFGSIQNQAKFSLERFLTLQGISRKQPPPNSEGLLLLLNEIESAYIKNLELLHARYQSRDIARGCEENHQVCLASFEVLKGKQEVIFLKQTLKLIAEWRAGILPSYKVFVLEKWVLQHPTLPCPDERDTRQLALQAELSIAQVNNWFKQKDSKIGQKKLFSTAGNRLGV
eukprot:TRINITY_DN1540_c0_g1_i1.p1 TRINITY_DN1540_c0_g1~~TRINITY_DN1540_c0_g1_i1.p1  ORF type:complete len:222 (+),score=19.07 TRINITY_DN1540_c0_g1_i1:553-1218(+)